MSKITETDYQEYSKLIEEGHSQRSACLILGLNRSTIQRYIKSVLEDEVSEGGEKYLELPKKTSFAMYFTWYFTGIDAAYRKYGGN